MLVWNVTDNPMNGMKLRMSRCAGLVAMLLASHSAHAMFLSGEALDTVADWIAIFVLIIVPIAAIVVFWLVHILPEKIAENRHHPQKDAIKTLCLLSLVIGGMLWPLAWLWAYSKPVLYKMAYGRDKHDDYYAETASAGKDATKSLSLHEELGRLRYDLEVLEKQGELSGSMQAIKDTIARLESRALKSDAAEATR